MKIAELVLLSFGLVSECLKNWAIHPPHFTTAPPKIPQFVIKIWPQRNMTTDMSLGALDKSN